MPIWRITPAPRNLESARQDYGRWSEVIVRASSAARARIVAATELADLTHPVANESAASGGGLQDEKLYHVARIADGAGRFRDDCRSEGVLKADWISNGR